MSFWVFHTFSNIEATVTRADFSEKAIIIAKELADEAGVKARFIKSNVYELSECIFDKFDIVFTSYGVLCWLPDLEKWAVEISNMLKNGGTFPMVEFHPLMQTLVDNEKGEVLVGAPYFDQRAQVYEPDGIGSYAAPNWGL